MTTITPDADFTMPARQAKAAIIIFILKFINNTFRKGWALLVPAFLALRKLSLDDWQIYLLGTMVALLYITFSYLSYQRFFYYTQGDEIIIEKGVLYKTKISLPFDKVQTINFKQNILQQALGVLTLQIDSAGSGKQEISLEALNESRAKHFRDYILDRKENVTSLQVDTEESLLVENNVEKAHVEEKRKVRTLLQLQPIDLLKIGISQNHLRSMAIFAAFLWNIYDQLKEQLNFDEDEKIQELTGAVGTEWLGTLGLMVIIVLLLSLIVSLAITFFRNFNFHLVETGDSIKKHYGLFERHEQSATLKKIQSVAWGDNPLKKLFGLFVFRMYPAASSELSSKRTISVPGCYGPQVKVIIDLIFGDQKRPDYAIHRMSPFYIRRNLLFFGILPAVVTVLIGYFFLGFYVLFFVLWVPLIYLAVITYHKKWRLYISDNIIRVRYGLFSHQNKMMYIQKVQAVKLSQSPYQKRKNLAALELYTAGRNFTVNYLDYRLALQLQNYILFKVENYKDSWM